MGRHARHVAVFTDADGRRTRLATYLVRGAAGVLLAGLVALIVSLLAGVPLPVAPAHLPRNEQPVRQGEDDPTPGITSPEPTPTTRMALPATRTPPAPPPSSGTPGGPTSATAGTPSTSATNGPPATPPPTPPGSGATSARPTRTATSHGRAPATPPGHTRHP